MKLSNPTSTFIYKHLVTDVFLEEARAYFTSRTQEIFSRHHISSSSTPPAPSILRNMESAKNLPHSFLFHHMKLCLNALATSSRRRFLGGPIADCHFCEQGPDSLTHIYGQCRIITAARCEFFSETITGFPKCASPNPHHVSCTKDFPLSASFLCDLSPEMITPTLIFNFAVWRFRHQALACKSEKGPAWIVSKLAAIGCFLSSSLTSPQRKKKPYTHISIAHNSTIAGLPDDAIICYTDGSASPNPGPCGAGITIFDPGGGLVHDGGLALGHGSNNIGELAALGACLRKIRSLPGHRTVVVFSDSEHAISMATSTKKPKRNPLLIAAVRDCLKEAKSKHLVTMCWIKGHIDIPGNTRVDTLAKHFASLPGSLNLDLTAHFTTSPWPMGPRLDLLAPNLITTPNF